MTIIQLREEVGKIAHRPLRRLRDNAAALIDLYAATLDGGSEGEAEELATRICDWGLDNGIIREGEYDHLHGTMTMHTREPYLALNPALADEHLLRQIASLV